MTPKTKALLGAAGAVALAGVAWAAAHPSPWIFTPPDWSFTPPPQTPQPEPAQTLDPGIFPQSNPSRVAGIVFTVIGILVAAAILALIARFVVRLVRSLLATRIEGRPPLDRFATGDTLAGSAMAPKELADATMRALQRLDDATTSTDAIIQSWLSIEDAAQTHHIGRDPAWTPTEFTAALLARSPVPTAATDGLRTLYLRTRFSDITPTAADVGQARAWLHEIADALEKVSA